MTRAVVLAYHNVGVRCLRVLLAHGVEVPLVVTHADSRGENIWFDSVARLAARHDLPCCMPGDVNDDAHFRRVRDAAPDFIFSFYFRNMISARLLQLAPRGAYNMHGSLLPHYRGRAPVNWAVLHGERETGATLHRMVEKPDAGEVVAQQTVPILPDDTALEVFQKVTVAAEMALDAVLPALLAGTAPHRPQDLAAGSYFGGRSAEDGRIDWRRPAAQVHNLVRAVAPPYPGAFCDLPAGRLVVLRTMIQPRRRARHPRPGLYVEDGRVLADCADGAVLWLEEATLEGHRVDAASFGARFAPAWVPLTQDC